MRIATLIKIAKAIAEAPSGVGQDLELLALQDRCWKAVVRSTHLNSYQEVQGASPFCAVSFPNAVTENNGLAFAKTFVSVHSPSAATAITFWLCNNQMNATVGLYSIEDGKGIDSSSAKLLKIGKRDAAECVTSFSMQALGTAAAEKAGALRISLMESLGFIASRELKKKIVKAGLKSPTYNL